MSLQHILACIKECDFWVGVRETLGTTNEAGMILSAEDKRRWLYLILTKERHDAVSYLWFNISKGIDHFFLLFPVFFNTTLF